MKARLMIHDGKSTITVPAEVSRYYDQDLMDYVTQELAPERVIQFEQPDGTKYGGYEVRKKVMVPLHAQKALFDKGFTFVRKEDETAFLQERKAIEAEIAKRKVAAGSTATTDTKPLTLTSPLIASSPAPLPLAPTPAPAVPNVSEGGK